MWPYPFIYNQNFVFVHLLLSFCFCFKFEKPFQHFCCSGPWENQLCSTCIIVLLDKSTSSIYANNDCNFLRYYSKHFKISFSPNNSFTSSRPFLSIHCTDTCHYMYWCFMFQFVQFAYCKCCFNFLIKLLVKGKFSSHQYSHIWRISTRKT